MAIALGSSDSPLLTPHEATALAALLGAAGSSAANSLARKLEGAASTGTGCVELSPDERGAFVSLIDGAQIATIPTRVLALRDHLAQGTALEP